MKTASLFILLILPLSLFAQEMTFRAGTNSVSIVFEDPNATLESKSLFLADLEKVANASQSGVSISVTTNKFHPAVFPKEPLESISLSGISQPKFMNGNVGFPTSLDFTNGVWALRVSKHYTDGFASLCEFSSTYSNEIAKLRTFVSSDLATDRLASLSDDDIYEMYLSKQWEPGDRNGPSNLPAENRPQILRGTYYQPPVAAVLSWPMGPSDAPEHLWAQINVRVGTRVYETRAIYYSDQWWLTIWDWEDDPPVWSP